MIGAEPFLNGVAKLLSHIENSSIDNIRILHGDARALMEALPTNSLSRLFVLHPDPWPKKRHFKRRMISPWFFREAARILVPEAQLRIASDIPDYIRWTANDWQQRPADWPQTRYEAKALREGRQPTYLIFRRR